MKHLIITLESPMMSFGAPVVDYLGPTREFPGAAEITGLLGNALGWTRTDSRQLNALQDNLVFASRIDREPQSPLHEMDFQTVALSPNDKGWTTRGVAEGRTASREKLRSKHLRYREYLADTKITLALRVNRNNRTPSTDELAQALNTPARPLFIGRKPFVPSVHMLQGEADTDTALQALLEAPLEFPMETPMEGPDNLPGRIRLMWPASEGHPRNPEVLVTDEYMLRDLKNWVTHLHGGARLVREGKAPPTVFQPPED